MNDVFVIVVILLSGELFKGQLLPDTVSFGWKGALETYHVFVIPALFPNTQVELMTEGKRYSLQAPDFHRATPFPVLHTLLRSLCFLALCLDHHSEIPNLFKTSLLLLPSSCYLNKGDTPPPPAHNSFYLCSYIIF